MQLIFDVNSRKMMNHRHPKLIYPAIFLTIVCMGCAFKQKNFSPSIFIQTTRRLSKQIGLDYLPIAQGVGASDEIRIWVGFGLEFPQKMLRIRRGPNVSGELFLWWPNQDIGWAQNLRAMYNEETMCQTFKVGVTCDICRAALPSDLSWAQILTSLENQSIWFLAEQPPQLRKITFILILSRNMENQY
jgi:hypothetical protein